MSEALDAWEVKRKKQENIETKLEIASGEGSEFGDAARNTLQFLQGYGEYIVGEDVIAKCYEAAEESCDEYFLQVADEAWSEKNYGHAGYRTAELISINEELASAGLPEVWPEDWPAKPSPEELEAGGMCADHPHQGDYSAPRNGCDRCIRLYVAAEDKRKLEAEAREAKRAEREAEKAAKT